MSKNFIKLDLNKVEDVVQLVNFFDIAILHAEHRIVNCSDRTGGLGKIGIGCITCDYVCTAEIDLTKNIVKYPFVKDVISDLRSLSYSTTGASLKAIAEKHKDSLKRIGRWQLMS